MSEFRIVAVTPPGMRDPSISIAATRAGAFGVVDLVHMADRSSISTVLERVARFATRNCGIRLDHHSAAVLETLPELPEPVEFAVVLPTEPALLEEQVTALRNRRLQIWLECTSLEEGHLGRVAGVDTLVAKGNEAGGRVGSETSFILLQRLLGDLTLPVLAHGGIGLHTAAACHAGGAAGVMLDGQLLLTREARMPEPVKGAVARMDGSETVCAGERLGEAWRFYDPPGPSAAKTLRLKAQTLAGPNQASSEAASRWRQEVRERLGWGSTERWVWPLGQDAAFAAPLARRFHTVGGILQALRSAADEHLAAAARLRPLDEGAPLARAHGTRYPIVQGPMTRVSDTARFALRVADAGALPFLALALMRGTEVEVLLEETKRLLGDRPWGVGILGFVPHELREEQLEAIRACTPSFALIAGGRPDQALSLEQAGIPTYLHVPSPDLLRLFLDSGARRFVFEGRECGGHVGPRSSFVLWNSMVETLLAAAAGRLGDCHVLFAGGIHDARSSAMVAAAATPLAVQGAKVGALLGTAYLFTDEAVEAGAIVEGFQQEAMRCQETVLLETGPGHATRCARTAYADTFDRERQRLLATGATAEELRAALEELNLGRLRIASKGIARGPVQDGGMATGSLRPVADAEQRAQGMYMAGQVVALRNVSIAIDQLHREIAVEGSRQLVEAARRTGPPSAERPRAKPCDVAIVGMACLLPKAPDLETFWHNILRKVDAITEIPADRWDWRRYFDPDPDAPDKVTSRWGGFLDDIAFDPLRYGIPPSSLPSIEPLQLLTLETVAKALEDAGYADRPFDRERTAVILGVGGGVADLGQRYAVRSGLPMVLDDVPPSVLSQLPEWTEDSFPGILLNVAAGRVANRFDLGGVNYTVDAACASSLAAVYLAARELTAGTSDMVIVGGADTVQNPFAYLAFSKTHALSPRGRCRTFDEDADGIAISEGVAILVLKRLADAERDGDRIYAVIKGVAGSSDGRARALTAPRPEGQALALRRAYEHAGFSPSTVRLVEAHGTGTVAGDQAEVETLRQVFETAGAPRDECAIGSVKSMIGHTKCTAGVAGMIKVTKALHHRVLPPTINVERPNSKAHFRESPFYVNSEPRPWLRDPSAPRRRAGVSAFGFGGTNFHATLEEYTGDFLQGESRAASRNWPAETLVWRAGSRQALLEAVKESQRSLTTTGAAIADLAASLWREVREQQGLTLAVVARSMDDLAAKLTSACRHLESPDCEQLQDPDGLYFAERQPFRDGKIAFLFPGQGSQHAGMLGELAMHFEEVREAFEHAQATLQKQLPRRLAARVFPPPAFSNEERQRAEAELTQTAVAQPALGAADMAMTKLLRALGVHPDMVAGHSYGEYVALCVAGVVSERVLYQLSEARGRCLTEAGEHGDLGTMAAVAEGRDRVAHILDGCHDVWIANLNAPDQTVISGTQAGVQDAIERLNGDGVETRPLNVACAFHSPLVAPARDRLARVLASAEFAAPCLPVYANTTAAPYPRDPDAISRALTEHLVNPVRFVDEIHTMYEAGARVFLEVGPRGVLTGLTRRILGSRPHLAVATDLPGHAGLLQLQLGLAQLLAQGLPVNLDRLYAGRSVRHLNLRSLPDETTNTIPTPTTWLVNGGRTRPLHEGATAPSTPKPAAPAPQPQAARAPRDLPAPRPAQAPPPAGADLPLPPPAAADGDPSDVILAFQRLMGRFLETQQQVMTSYLQGGNGHPPAATTPVDRRRPLAAPSAEPAETAGASAPDAAPEDPASAQPGVIATLLAIVSDRTGYPPEMLDLDLDMEAELGVDSIKRVEILGALQRACQPSEAELIRQATEQLVGIKTIRELADAVTTALGRDLGKPRDMTAASPDPDPAADEEAGGRAHPGRPSRFLTTTVEAPLAEVATPATVRGTFLITDDGGLVAEALAERLRRAGGHPVIVRARGGDGQSNGVRAVDLTDAAAIDLLLHSIRQHHEPIAGLVHLLPLQATASPDAADSAAWHVRLDLEVKALFRLARAVAPDLLTDSEGGWLLAATTARPAQGGPARLATNGGVAGLVKTLALEWPQVRAKVVEVDPAAPPPDVAARLFEELTAGDDAVEVAYAGSTRTVPAVRPAPLNQTTTTPASASPPRGALQLDSSSVVLVTGGARGITAVIARGLAGYRPLLVLTGRSPLPPADESATTAGIDSPRELKSALIEQARQAGRPVMPTEIEQSYIRLLREREMRANLAAMRQAGAIVHYHQVDVRDEKAFAALLDSLYEKHGRLDGVVHGAGVIEDKLLQDKSDASFDRVFDTKVTGARILIRSLRPETLRFLVFFASVAGRFGNRGQSDYAAANEALNKLAAHLDQRFPGRVVAINWGPWSGAGMVSPEVLRQFAERQVEAIDLEAGWRAFEQELRLGSKGETEVILADGPWLTPAGGRAAPSSLEPAEATAEA